MVGGEKKDDKVTKERRRKRKLFADERKQKLAGNCLLSLLYRCLV